MGQTPFLQLSMTIQSADISLLLEKGPERESTKIKREGIVSSIVSTGH